ncbi:MAG: rhodanese-like domain-containing protein [Bacteroidales bacterium]|nr:rhodanese-like domain-containing protein [Bacteroidales bacterium]
MKQLSKYIIIFLLPISILTYCGSKNSSHIKELVLEVPENVNENDLLYNFIEQSGDIVNSDAAPALVVADEVASNLSKYLVLDIRNHDAYVDGHIDGAIQVNASDLMDYLDKEASPANYEKIVLACYSGQTAAYYTSLLRFAGYGNVFALKYGMSGWSKKISDNKWTANISNNYAGLIETKGYQKGEKHEFPKIETGATTGFDIMKARVNAVSEEGFGKAIIKVDTVMQHPDKYYIINYWPMDRYVLGHLPGAVQYTPKTSLKKEADLSYLPTDKPIVVYCYTGQHSAFVAAYLRILGYDAHSLAYGANGFMNAKMQAEIGHAFGPSVDINDYELVAGEKPSLKTVETTSNAVSSEKPVITPPKKKKKEASSGGC